MTTCYIDADTILVASSAQYQDNQLLVKHLSSCRERVFASKTDFNKWLSSSVKKDGSCWNADEFLLTPSPVLKYIGGEHPLPLAINTIKNKIASVFEASGCDDYVVCIEGEGNFRKDYPAKYVHYKGNRTGDKPLLFAECKEWMERYYGKQGRLISAVGVETDDIVVQKAWSALVGGRNDVIAYCDKDIPANAEGWMLNYKHLEDGLKWHAQEERCFNFAVQMLMGDAIDNIPGVEVTTDELVKKYGVRKPANLRVGETTAKGLLKGCSSQKELAERVVECYTAAHGDEWKERMNEMGFFLYMLRSENDKWDVDWWMEGSV